jgi:hypothetical protein
MSHNEFTGDPESAKEIPPAKRAVPNERGQKALFQQAVGGLQKREIRTKAKESFEGFVRRLCIARGAPYFSEIAATTALQWIGCTPESFANSNAKGRSKWIEEAVVQLIQYETEVIIPDLASKMSPGAISSSSNDDCVVIEDPKATKETNTTEGQQPIQSQFSKVQQVSTSSISGIESSDQQLLPFLWQAVREGMHGRSCSPRNQDPAEATTAVVTTESTSGALLEATAAENSKGRAMRPFDFWF